LNQQFASYLKEEGLNYNRSKLNMYYKRGKVPEADLTIGDTLIGVSIL
jgi:hypothetical protein